MKYGIVNPTPDMLSLLDAHEIGRMNSCIWWVDSAFETWAYLAGLREYHRTHRTRYG